MGNKVESNLESNLEMRCSDGAWYDGTLQVSPKDKYTIIVHFNNFDEDEDETFSKWDVRDPALLRSKVRVQSIQLQDSQCRLVEKEQKICGCLDNGAERKYYDAEVTRIERKEHRFKKKGGEVCLCEFELYWIDGPRKGEKDKVGCDKVCFLSSDRPEDDPMISTWLRELAAEEQRLVKSTAPKGMKQSLASPSPSPSLEPAPLKKQKLLEPVRTASVGSKKKRILQARGELADLESDSALKVDSSRRPKEGHEKATGRGGESDVAEQRVMSGGSEGNNGMVRAAEKKRLVKGKSKLKSPDQEVVREDVTKADIPNRTFKEQHKSKVAKIASPVEAAVPVQAREDMVTQSMGERVKLKKTPKMAVPDVAAAAGDEGIIQIEIVQSLAERVKLKTALKSPAAEAHKVSLQKLGKQMVGKQIVKRKLIQLEDVSVDPLSSKFDKVAKRRTIMQPRGTPAQPKNVEPAPPKVQRRKAGRPKKVTQVPGLANPVIESTTAQMQQVGEISSARQQSPQEEEVVHDTNVENCSSNPPRNKTSKKRPQDEERLQYDNNESSQEESLDAHVRKHTSGPVSKENENHFSTGDHARVLLLDMDTVSAKSPNMAEDEGDCTPLPTHSDEAIEMSYHPEKVSMGAKLRDIENKYRTNAGSSALSTPQAAQELISLAGTNPHHETLPDDHFKLSSPASHQEASTSGKSGKRRRFGKRPFVITDDEAEDTIVHSEAKDQQCRGCEDAVDSSGQDECNPIDAQAGPTTASDPKVTCSALDEEMAAPRQGTVLDTRMLVLENLEPNASALDAMELLQTHTLGVCAVHVLPVVEFHTSVVAYALYRDSSSALQALEWLTSSSRFIVSPEGRPWIVSLAKEVYKPSLYGFAIHTAYKSDDPSMCGVVSDQPHVHDLVVVTEGDKSAYLQAQQMIKTFEEHKKWQKELYERIVQHEKEGREIGLFGVIIGEAQRSKLFPRRTITLFKVFNYYSFYHIQLSLLIIFDSSTIIVTIYYDLPSVLQKAFRSMLQFHILYKILNMRI